MLPLRSVLNRAYALLLADRDEKQRAEVIDDLWAAEEHEQAEALAKVAEFAERAGQRLENVDDDA